MYKGLKQKVEQVLRDNPHTRNSDKHLILWVWWAWDEHAFMKDEDGRLWVNAEKTLDLPPPESIRRFRQKFQTPSAKYPEGKYPATDLAIKEERLKRMKKMTTSQGWTADQLA